MEQHIPRSPFATRLSGSARETELRILNIFQGPKKRPPVLIIVLTVLVILSCGWLVSCQPREEQPSDGASASGTQESVSHEPVSQPIRNTIKGERLADYNIEYLTDEQRELLADLPASELPREPVDLWDLRRRDIWRDTSVPLLLDREPVVTFYLVVSTPSGDLDDALPAAYAGHSLTPAGIVLRVGDRAVYHPLLLDCWYGPNCWMEIDDFDGDWEDEIALCLFSGGGTGVWVESLYFFELDTLDYSAPDCSAFGNILVDYDPDAQTAALSLPGSRESLTVDVSNYLPFRGAEVGNQVSYTLVDGQIYCRVMIDFMATVGYAAAATAPVRWDGSQWTLGEISLSTLASN